MNAKQRMMVIVEDGKVVGTQAIAEVSPSAPASAVLVAGPKQVRMELDVARPEYFASEADIQAFHKSLEAHIAKMKG